MSTASRHRLWSATRRLSLALLALWLLLNLFVPWFARDLNQWQLLGFPLGFWVAGQGALIGYLLIILVYIFGMEALEARYLAETTSAEDAQAP